MRKINLHAHKRFSRKRNTYNNSIGETLRNEEFTAYRSIDASNELKTVSEKFNYLI